MKRSQKLFEKDKIPNWKRNRWEVIPLKEVLEGPAAYYQGKIDEMNQYDEERELFDVAAQWKTEKGAAWYTCNECGECMPSTDWHKHCKTKNHRGKAQDGHVRCIEILSGALVQIDIRQFKTYHACPEKARARAEKLKRNPHAASLIKIFNSKRDM